MRALVIAGLSLLTAVGALAGEDECMEATPLRLDLSLTDGSCIIGTPGIEGGLGRQLRLDGENDHVRVPNSPSLELRTAVTVCARVKLNSFGPAGYRNEFGFIVNKG